MIIYFETIKKAHELSVLPVSIWKWLFGWNWGVTKFGDREWGLRIFGIVIENEVGS